jgi:23S rRNA pseudouridine2604 synthase
MEFPMRINKYLAHKGFSTRRGADTLIESGKVFVNRKPALIGQQVTEKDTVEVRDKNVRRYIYMLYNKPRGIITHSPAEHETDIVTHIKETHGITGVFPVGRLDKDSEGLMILTDDGRITERILSPEKAHEKEYLVAVDKKVTTNFLNRLERGVDIEGYVTKEAKAMAIPGKEKMFRIVLTEGKKHQVRRMCAALGYQIKTLKRTRILNFTINSLKPGGVRTLGKTDAEKLRKTLGLR